MTLLTVIGLTYSVIAPLVSGFAFLAFALFWFVYKVCSTRALLAYDLFFANSVISFSFISTCSFTFTTYRLVKRREDCSIPRLWGIFSSDFTLNNFVSLVCSSSLRMPTRSNLLSERVSLFTQCESSVCTHA